MNGIAKKTHLKLIVATVFISLIFVSVLALGWYYIIGLSNQVNSQTTEAENFNRESAALQTLKVRINKVLAQKELVYQAIPTAKEVSSFIANFELEARKYNLTLANTAVGDTKSKIKAGSDYSQAINKQEYYELPIHYELGGKYEDFTAFITNLSTMRRLNAVDNIVVISDTSDLASPTKIKAQFDVIIFAKK